MNTKPKFCGGRGSTSVRIIKMFLKPHYVGQIQLSNEEISVSEGRRNEAVKRKLSTDLYTDSNRKSQRTGYRTHSKLSKLQPLKRKLEVEYESSLILVSKRVKRSSSLRKGYLFRAEETKLVSRTFVGVFSARIQTTISPPSVQPTEYQFSKSNDRLCDQEVESIMQEVQTLSLECKLESVEYNLKDPISQRIGFKDRLLYGSFAHTSPPDFLKSALKHEMNYKNFMKDSVPDSSVHNAGKAECAIEVADIIQTRQSTSCRGSTLLYAIDGVFVVLIILMVILVALTY